MTCVLQVLSNRVGVLFLEQVKLCTACGLAARSESCHQLRHLVDVYYVRAALGHSKRSPVEVCGAVGVGLGRVRRGRSEPEVRCIATQLPQARVFAHPWAPGHRLLR